MFDISQSSTIIIENTLSTLQCYFLGKIDVEKNKHGYDEKITIYGVRKIKYSALNSKIPISITFIDIENRQLLNNFFITNSKINVVDQNNVTYPNLTILGDSLKFTTSYDDDGNEFYTTSFEVG